MKCRIHNCHNYAKTLNPDQKIESDGKNSERICQNKKRKRDSTGSEGDYEEIVLSSRTQRETPSDDDEVQNDNGKRNVSSREWIWKDTENDTKIWKYSKISEINIPVEKNVTPLQMTNEILTEDFWNLIVTETNRYANQILQKDNYNLRKVEDDWLETSRDEIKSYFALCILMSQIQKPTVVSYWSMRKVVETPIFQKTMPYWRFAQLSRFLHFTNDEDGNDNDDSLWKVQSVIDYFNVIFPNIYTPAENVSLDESIMKYYSRISECNPSKKPLSGVRFYKLCESESGYCIKFKIYANQDEDSNSNIRENATIFMSTVLSGHGHTLFLDSWYFSPNLLHKLHTKKINLVGTVRLNRKNMPKELTDAKLKQSDVMSRCCNGILLAKWKHKKDIYMISTKHRQVKMVESEKGRKSITSPISKPNIFLEYSDGMTGVDLQGGYLSSFKLMKKYVQSYKKIFFYLVDIALLNSYVLFCKRTEVQKYKKYTFSNFRMDVAEEILTGVCLPDYKKRGKVFDGNAPNRLQAKQWGHFPRNIPPTNSKKNPQRRCVVCTKHKKRSETTWECKKCLVALHIPTCFEKYHTLKNY